MGKVVDYIEFLKMIKDKQIKAGTKLKIMGEIFYYNGSCICRNDNHERLASYLWECNLINTDVEILSEDEEIDIEAIEIENELSISANYRMIMNLTKAVKQLNKKLEEK